MKLACKLALSPSALIATPTVLSTGILITPSRRLYVLFSSSNRWGTVSPRKAAILT